MPKKVGILTTFYEVDSGFSLVSVVETQIKMLLDHGYDPIVLVRKGFEETKKKLWQKTTIDIRLALPSFGLVKGIHSQFESRAELVRVALEENFTDVDVILTHDIMLQEDNKEHNVAVREYARIHPNVLWLHWIHSCPTPNNTTSWPESVRNTPPPGYLIYPNDSDKSIVCQAYNLANKEWKIKVSRASHAIDPLSVWNYDKLTVDIINLSGFLDSDIAVVYPVRLDKGKQPEKIIRLISGIKKAGRKAKLIIVDWQSAGEGFQKYIDRLIELAISLDIEKEVFFTSRLHDKANQGVPRHVVTELMDLSTVYIHPSRVETYSLVVHEAMLRGKLVVLNYDFPAMRENFGSNAIYMDFGSERNNRKYKPDEQTFWDEESKRLLAEVSSNSALVA